MRSRRILLGTSWKMNKTTQEAFDYVGRLLEELRSTRNLQKVQIFVIPPFTCLSAVKQRSSGKFWVGAQNMHSETWGAFTGEISAPMLKDLGVDMVELGHAERRHYFNENDVAINRKVQLALQYGIRPLICVGESAEEKDFGVERESVARQIKIALKGVSVDQLSSIIVAYEPTWAIGNSGSAAEPGYIRIMSNHIRQVLRSLFGEKARILIPVIYGGTVNSGNAGEILARGGLDGLFIGRAAWDAEAFASLIRISLESISDCSNTPPKLMARKLQKGRI
jgi:L-erythrulose 1-phosphate isomerase